MKREAVLWARKEVEGAERDPCVEACSVERVDNTHRARGSYMHRSAHCGRCRSRSEPRRYVLPRRMCSPRPSIVEHARLDLYVRLQLRLSVRAGLYGLTSVSALGLLQFVRASVSLP